jgi:hypothetical protein
MQSVGADDEIKPARSSTFERHVDTMAVVAQS